MRVLVCAFACDPKGASGLGTGEDLLGWNIVDQISRFHETWTITSPQNKSGVESILNQGKLNNAHFFYVELPNWLQWPLQHFWSQGGSQVYAYLWQLRAYISARILHKEIQFHIFHHVTYANDWMTSFNGALLPISYIRGPGGGAHRVPKRFLRVYSISERLWEYFRVIGQWLFRHDPFFIKGQKRARAILLCNQESVNAMQKGWRNNIYLFPVNGINASDLKPSDQSQKENKTDTFRILSAGRLTRFKGFSLAIRAFQRFITNYPEAEFRILGEGPDRPYLQHLIRNLGLHSKLHLQTWIPRDELLDAMRESDVFLFPSFRDGGGAVVVEAMASGLPVICLDIGGPGFHIQDGWGIKIKPESPEYVVNEMAKALERLYLDRDLREGLGKAARKRAEDFYLWDRLGERLMKIYEEALGKIARVGDDKASLR